MPKRLRLLQGYYWDTRNRNYIRAATGRFVARSRIVGLLDKSIAQRETRLYKGVQRFADGELSSATFLSRSRTMLKRQYLQNRALAKGGWDRLTPRDYGAVGGKLRWQYQRLATMAQQLNVGEISTPQALNRMRMYMGDARAEFYRVERDELPRPKLGSMYIERRRLGQAEHCESCLRYASLGWQPERTLPVPGDESECDGNCRCEIERKEIPGVEAIEWVGRATQGGKVLAVTTE